MYDYRLQLPKMDMPVYTPRKGAGRVATTSKMEVELSPLLREHPDGTTRQYIPRSRVQVTNAVWLSAIINFPVNAHGCETTKVFGEGFIYNESYFCDYCYRYNPRFDPCSLYEAVDALNAYSNPQGGYFSLHRIDMWDNVLMALIEGYSVLVGGSVYKSFQNADASGIVPMPKPQEDLLGGQIVNLVAYDANKRIGTFLGSRGPRTGRMEFSTATIRTSVTSVFAENSSF